MKSKKSADSAAHAALYRKYRPQTFKDVIGQDHVVKVLENSIAAGNIAHAYLFAGTRGTGKTSVARIFASEIGTSEHDLYEMDAASNRGIDDIREIREGVNTVPFESKYKVYIIDEAHMLTKEAFNALLKTLEEPPSHAVFILATTETDKLPETVVSRCQTFTFKKPNQEMLRESSRAIAKKEGFDLEPAAADLVAILGDGSFRDTQGILQKVISAANGAVGAAGKKISLAEVELVTGAPRSAIIRAFVEAISVRNTEQALAAIQQAVEANVDMKVFVKLVLEKCRFVLLLAHAPEMAATIQERVSAEEFAYLKTLSAASRATGASPSGLTFETLLELLKASQQIGRAFIAQLPLELAVMKIGGGRV